MKAKTEMDRVPDIGAWMNRFTEEMQREYGSRIVLIGLQGSYGRGEAKGESDIDTVLILDELTMRDLIQYKQLIPRMPHRDKICGFVSGKNELLHWEKSELFQFCHDTRPWFGTLEDVLSSVKKQDVKRAALIGACNIYHTSVHNFLHENQMEILRAILKTAFFVLQAKCYYETGTYIRSKQELRLRLCEQERELLDAGMANTDMLTTQFNELSEKLIAWAGTVIDSFGGSLAEGEEA